MEKRRAEGSREEKGRGYPQWWGPERQRGTQGKRGGHGAGVGSSEGAPMDDQ